MVINGHPLKKVSSINRTFLGGGTKIRCKDLSAAWRSGLECCVYDDHDRKVNGSTRATPISESRFALRIAPPPLSRDERIRMKKSINHHILWKALPLVAFP